MVFVPLKSIEHLVRTDDPIFFWDVDQVFVEKHSVNDRGFQTEYRVTEEGIENTLDVLQKRYPNAKFIALSNGQSAKDKLFDKGLSQYFTEIIDIDTEEYKPMRYDKGAKINYYFNLEGTKGKEIVFIDGSLENHQSVASHCSKNHLITHVHYVRAFENLRQVTDEEIAKNERVNENDRPALTAIREANFMESLMTEMENFRLECETKQQEIQTRQREFDLRWQRYMFKTWLLHKELATL